VIRYRNSYQPKAPRTAWRFGRPGRHVAATIEVQRAASLTPSAGGPIWQKNYSSQIVLPKRSGNSERHLIWNPFFAPAHYVLG